MPLTFEGQSRPLEQNDGSASQTAALLAAFRKLDWASQQVAGDLIGRNFAFL